MKKRILIIVNQLKWYLKLRRELLEALASSYEIHLSSPADETMRDLEKYQCYFHPIKIDRRGTNPVRDFTYYVELKRLLRRIQPDVVLTYTIKPNVYGGLACRDRYPFIATITGVGSALYRTGMLEKLVRSLYRRSLSRAFHVFFQNAANLAYFRKHRIIGDEVSLIAGSGVNLDHFQAIAYPKTKGLHFVFIGRVMREKGIEEYLAVAQFFAAAGKPFTFHVCGDFEEKYEHQLSDLHDKEIIVYHGYVADTRPILAQMNCLVLPSYHEGMSNVILEASAMGRPVIATDIPGCREAIDDGYTGLLIQPANKEDLIRAVEMFEAMSHDEREKMGLRARAKMETGFNRKNIVEKYCAVINEAIERANTYVK